MRGSLIKDCKIDVDELGKQIQARKSKDKKFFQNLIQETENDIESNKKSMTLNWIALVFSYDFCDTKYFANYCSASEKAGCLYC